MTRVNLIKYGFVRWPERDFSDDGSRFTCFKAGKNVEVTKLVADGQAYLSCDSSVGKGTLPYDTYKTLPHYNDATWKYNGVSVKDLTDEDLKNFYDACVAYEQEYEAAEASIKYPTLDEIRQKALRITAKRSIELDCIELWLKDHCLEAIAKFTTYEWKQVQEYTRNLIGDAKRYHPDIYPQTIFGKQGSFDFVKPEYDMKDSFYYTYIKEIFEKYNLI